MGVPAPNSHTEAEKFFDQIAQDYRARSEGQVYNVSSLSFARRQEVVSSLLANTPEGGTVLDYGMGPAVFGPPAIAKGLNYVGIDISQKMIDLAVEMNLPRAEYHRGDLALLGQFKAKADTVLLIGLIDYLEDPVEGLRALARCVKPGGRIILSFRNHRSIPRLLRNSCKAAYRAFKSESHESGTAFAAPVLERSFVPQRDLIPTLRDEGFQEFETRYLDASPVFWKMPLPKPIWHLWKKADAVFSQPFLSGLCASGVLMASAKK
jgi:SAM-dependent methyltransferase